MAGIPKRSRTKPPPMDEAIQYLQPWLSSLSLGSLDVLHGLVGRLLQQFHFSALHHLHREFALDVLLVTAIWFDFMLHWLAGRMQVVGFPLADADVVAPGHGKQTKFVPVGPHFIENWCEVADPREDLFTNIGVDVLDADLQAATLT